MAASGGKWKLCPIHSTLHPLFQLVVTRAEVLANMDEAGSAYTSKDMFAGSKAEVDFVQV